MLREIITDYTFQVVLLGTVILGYVSGTLGCYTVLRKESLISDSVAHSALPGIVLAFLIVGSKKLEVLLLGAILTGGLSIACTKYIVKHTKLKLDSVLAMVLSVFFGAGLTLLTVSQKLPNANQAGLETFIYGQASTILLRDVKIIAMASIFIVLTILILWKEFKIITFDKEFAYTIGLPVTRLETLLTGIIVVAIVIGLQSVGAILMSAMMIAPAIAAKQWMDNMGKMFLVSGILGVIASTLGTLTSAIYTGIPTGPTIVVYGSLIAILSILFSRRSNKK